MRLLHTCLLLLRCGCAVRLGQQRERGRESTSSSARRRGAAEPAKGQLLCRAGCADRGDGPESRPCPFAEALDAAYWNWTRYHSCRAKSARVELSCGGTAPGGFGEEVRRQLGGKRVVMVGDSTMRQTYIGLLCLIWEEGLVGNDTLRAVEKTNATRMQEDNGLIEADFPELGEGTRFTFIRKNWGRTGPVTMRALDTADISVANMAMHYNTPGGVNEHFVQEENATYKVRYAEDVQNLLHNMSARGRPGHRAFWRQAQVCASYDYGGRPGEGYGCMPELNRKLDAHNKVVAELPAYKGVEVLPAAELFLPAWWAHPGGHDCCHMVGGVPGLLSVVPRMLVTMLAQPAGAGIEVKKTSPIHDGRCPNTKRLCEDQKRVRPVAMWDEFEDAGI